MLDPDVSRYFFDESPYGPMPADEQDIICHLRDGRVVAGRVELVWLAMDTPCIKVRTLDGHVNMFQEFGDWWEPVG